MPAAVRGAGRSSAGARSKSSASPQSRKTSGKPGAAAAHLGLALPPRLIGAGLGVILVGGVVIAGATGHRAERLAASAAAPATAAPAVIHTQRDLSCDHAPAGPDLAESGRLFTGLAELLLRALAFARPAPRTAAGIRVLRDPEHQIVEPNTQVSRLLGDERSGGHSGLSVDL